MTYTIPPTVARARARAAALSRHSGPDAPETRSAKTELAAANISAYVERIVCEAPPLSAEQREAIIAAFAGFSAPSHRREVA